MWALSLPHPTPPLTFSLGRDWHQGRDPLIETLLLLGAGVKSLSPSSHNHVFPGRGVKKEDKTLAVGMQFMLLRVLGKLLAQRPRWWW